MKAPTPGEVIDSYRIDELVARGGMATLFKATDLRTGTRVALKIPHPEAECDALFFDRFRREAEIGRECDHPGVIKVFPKQGEKRVYMAMEWVDGRVLRHILHEQQTIAPDRATRIAIGICDALEYIHSHGVVHRDLKPENVMVGADDQIKLIDFGIAGKTGARRLTFGRPSAMIGTVDYISPEQVKGKRGDSRSDIYALGVMLYEMVSGQSPFLSPNPFVAMNDRLVSDAIPVRQLNPSVSPELEAIIAKAMRRNPIERYASARDLSFDLLHPAQVDLAQPAPPKPRARRLLFYSALAAIPGSILGLMLYMAGRQ